VAWRVPARPAIQDWLAIALYAHALLEGLPDLPPQFDEYRIALHVLAPRSPEWNLDDLLDSCRPRRENQDPISQIPLAIGAYWGGVKPFIISKSGQFRIPPPPALNSLEYAVGYDEVKRLGGDGITTPTERTPEQTRIGIYWAYDGTPSLCAPPRMYNQIVVHIADQMHSSDVELARLLALANLAMADTAISGWDSKFFHQLWRPITGIREADAGTGPTGLGDGNPLTEGDADWTPLGAPAMLKPKLKPMTIAPPPLSSSRREKFRSV